MEKRIKERMMLFAERRGDRAPGHPRSPPPGLPPSLSRDLPARPGVSKSVDLVYYSAHKSRIKQFLLGLLVLLLIGVVDAAESEELGDQRKKAEQGQADAQFGLAGMYYQGRGVTRDYGEALAWVNIAAISGDKFVVQMRDNLENRLGPQATLAAQRRSKELLKQIVAGKLKSGG